MKIRVKVDPDSCIGAGSCAVMSGVFEMNDENKADVVKGEGEDRYEKIIDIEESELDEIVMAAQSCPTLAVSIINEETGETLYPEN